MIFCLIPVYNEEQNLERLFRETRTYMNGAGYKKFRFIFVNDGSSDQSLAMLEDFQKQDSSVIILSHFPNKGVKRTFLDGFQKFLEIGKEGDILITKEADNTSDNAIMDAMIKAISDEKYDIALASCYAKGGGLDSTTLFRTFLSSGANLLIKVRFGLWGIYTFSSFYRSFSYSCLKQAFNENQKLMTYDGFTCVVEMLIKMKKMNFKIKEIPMLLRSAERVGKSKMPICKTIFEYIKLCIKGV
jgi:dolichol-phosphate mannosyltransferase